MDWNSELEKCRNSFYYFFSNYFLVGGEKVKTKYSEKEINEMWNNYKRNKYDTKTKRTAEDL